MIDTVDEHPLHVGWMKPIASHPAIVAKHLSSMVQRGSESAPEILLRHLGCHFLHKERKATLTLRSQDAFFHHNQGCLLDAKTASRFDTEGPFPCDPLMSSIPVPILSTLDFEFYKNDSKPHRTKLG